MAEDQVEQVRRNFARAAGGWGRWAQLLTDRDDAPRYIRAARVAPGHHVLEIGAGGGSQTLPLARHVGAEGRVVATDLTPEMLAIGRRRAEAEGMDNVDFRVADVMELPFEDGPFDAAVSGLTWMFLPDPVRAAAGVKAALRPGAWFAASVWGPIDQQPMIRIAVRAVTDALGIAPAAPAGDGPDLSDATTFHLSLCRAGFVDVTVRPFPLRISWTSTEEYAAWVRDMMVELGDLVRAHAPNRVEEVFAAVADAARAYAAADGRVVCTNTALMGAGRRP